MQAPSSDLGARVTALEAYVDMPDKHTGMTVTGRLMAQHDLLTAFRADFDDFRAQTDRRLTAVETRLTSVETRLTSVETRLTSVETRLTSVETRLSAVEDVLGQVLHGMTAIKNLLTQRDGGWKFRANGAAPAPE